MYSENIAVSVIVPVYNAEPYLRECLETVLNQTLKNIEVIIIDDGSTDGSSAICQEYLKKDNRIVYYKKENEGLAAARQDGIERAKGEYIGFVDSDDWIELDMYERMFSVAQENDADIVFCNCYLDEDTKDKIHLEPGVYDREKIESEILTRSLSGISAKGTNSVIRWSNCLRIYRASLIRDNNISFGRNFRRSQDLQLTFETTLKAQKYVSINDEFLYHNRTVGNGNSLSRGYTKNYWKLIRPLIDVLYNDVKNYKEQDLSSGMHLCAFFFAVQCIENELKATCPNDFSKKAELVDEIINDPVCQDFYGKIDVERLNPLFNEYYKLMAKKDAKKLLKRIPAYINSTKAKATRKKKIMDFLTESAVVGTVYKSVRKHF